MKLQPIAALVFFVCLFAASLLPMFDAPVRAQGGDIENAEATIRAARGATERAVQQTRNAREAELAAQRATATRLWVVQQQEGATRAAIAVDETRVARTATAEANAVATAEAYASATAQANDRATATAEVRATATAYAQATATARAEQAISAQRTETAQETAQAQATATQAAMVSKEFESKLQRDWFTTAAQVFIIFASGATALSLAAVLAYRELTKIKRARPQAVTQVIVSADRAATDSQFADLAIPSPFGETAGEHSAGNPTTQTAPITVVTQLPQEVIREVTEAFANARKFDSIKQLPRA